MSSIPKLSRTMERETITENSNLRADRSAIDSKVNKNGHRESQVNASFFSPSFLFRVKLHHLATEGDFPNRIYTLPHLNTHIFFLFYV